MVCFSKDRWLRDRTHLSARIAIGLLIFSAPLMAQNRISPGLTLDDLLSLLPAKNAVESRLIHATLLHSTPQILTRLMDMLSSPNNSRRVQAQYAINGLARYVTRPGLEVERHRYTNILLAALHRDSTYQVKSFLIKQLQIAGTEETVMGLVPFLKDDRLCDPAVQALLAIRGEQVDSLLLRATSQQNRHNQLTIINALGELSSKSALPFLSQQAGNSDQLLREAALSALADIGVPRAKSLLQAAVTNDTGVARRKAYSRYLHYAERLFENGYQDTGIAICEEIFQKAEEEYFRSAALTLLVKWKKEAALNTLLTAFASHEPKLQATALRSSRWLPGEKITATWVKLIPSVSSWEQRQILLMLGERGDTSALPGILGQMNSADKQVRMAAVSAAVKIDKETTLGYLFDYLRRSEDPEEIATIKTALLQYDIDKVAPAIEKALRTVGDEAKIALLGVLSTRRAAIKTGNLFALVKSSNPKVRVAGWKALAHLARENDLNRMLKLYIHGVPPAEQGPARRALVSNIQRSPNPERVIRFLVSRYKKSGKPVRLQLLEILANFRDPGVREILISALKNPDSKIREAALRAMGKFSDPGVIPVLLQRIHTGGNDMERILAGQALNRILQTSELPEKKKIRMYRQLIQAPVKIEEKRQAIAALATIPDREVFNYLATLLSNDSLKNEAASGIMNLASFFDSKEKTIHAGELALALTKPHLDELGQNRLDDQFPGYSGLNQPPEGFTALFNGRDLQGWKGLVADPVKRAQMSEEELAAAQQKADRLMRKHWHVRNGILVFDGKGSNLCTARDYADFELLVDWKIEKHGDSGIYLRGSPQVQIWDPAQWPEGSGGLYNNKIGPSKPLEPADNPVGEWNTFRIIMIGERVTVYLNDVLVVNNVVLENYWERDKPIYATGSIELQSHHTPLYFRNIFIREIPPERPRFRGSIFNGKNLTGWEQVGGSPGSWGVKNGILFTKGEGGGWLSTREEYDNFILELEFRVFSGGNSGVFLRAPRQGNPAYAGMEIQILDDYAEQYTHLKPWQYTGSLYGVVPPAVRASKKAGQWQKLKIVCNGPLLQVDLNGHRIVDIDLTAYMYLETTHPGLKRRKGYIGLQVHTHRVEFRNIRLTEL